MFTMIFDDSILSFGPCTPKDLPLFSQRDRPYYHFLITDGFPCDLFLDKSCSTTCWYSCPWPVLFSLATSEDIIFSRCQCKHLFIFVTFFLCLILSPSVKQPFSFPWMLSNRSTVTSLLLQVSVTLCGLNLWAHAICLSPVPEDQLSEISFLASSGAKMTSFENSWCCFLSRHWESIKRGLLTPTLINNKLTQLYKHNLGQWTRDEK